jgi:MFS family permease
MKKWSIVGILALAQFVMVLDSTVMNVSISAVVKDLDTTVNAMQAAITFYTLTMASLMLLGAKLCAKWGLMKAFVIGSIVYGIGSFITAISPNIGVLMLGWSLIEALGAVLVIPAIAALVAVHYTGKDRITAYAIIGGVSGAAAAAGPLIGGFMTTYLSWRYVFLFETIIMIFVLFASRSFKLKSTAINKPIDVLSAVMSAVGMCLVVFGMLQSKVWGWVEPIIVPSVNGHPIAPLGISLVAYLILAGSIILWLFYNRQERLEKAKKNPLLEVSMLKARTLRAGLGVLMSQYLIIASIFFVVPIYLQMVNGLDALQTGLKLMPLSIALILCSLIGTKLVSKYSPRFIVRIGQALLVVGSIFLLIAVNKDLTGVPFASAMFFVGAGLGLLASQLGNVNMSAAKENQTSEVGGLQGTFQNLGSSLGTALIGSILIASLTTGFISNINNADLPESTKDYVNSSVKTVQIVPAASVEEEALSHGYTTQQAQEISNAYKEAQLSGLKESIFFLIVLAILSIGLSRGIPNKVIK